MIGFPSHPTPPDLPPIYTHLFILRAISLPPSQKTCSSLYFVTEAIQKHTENETMICSEELPTSGKMSSKLVPFRNQNIKKDNWKTLLMLVDHSPGPSCDLPVPQTPLSYPADLFASLSWEPACSQLGILWPNNTMFYWSWALYRVMMRGAGDQCSRTGLVHGRAATSHWKDQGSPPGTERAAPQIPVCCTSSSACSLRLGKHSQLSCSGSLPSPLMTHKLIQNIFFIGNIWSQISLPS